MTEPAATPEELLRAQLVEQSVAAGEIVVLLGGDQVVEQASRENKPKAGFSRSLRLSNALHQEFRR